MTWFARLWARTGMLTLLLLPLAGLFAFVTGVRRLAYRRGWLASVAVGVPVVVVGNITAGGSARRRRQAGDNKPGQQKPAQLASAASARLSR